MVATINLTVANRDLVGYFTNWTANFGYNGNGEFSPSFAAATQWAAGNVAGTTNSGVIMNGNFAYVPPGGFTGTVNNLQFGTDLNGSTASGFSLATAGLTVQIGDAPNAALNGAIYSLSHGGSFTGVTAPSGNAQPGLYDYFGQVGTVQNGTALADRLYSFDGNDDLNGGAGRDTFVFDRDIAGSLASSIGNDSVSGFVAGANGDFIDLSGLASTAFDTYAEVLAASSQVGANTVIDFGGLGTITLEGVNRSALTSGNFVF
ncbi:hemolysin [Rhizobium sp. LC145]|uniref:hemolysin n=1 Tax=Rhizobium sp. LC145 TaxID=1120688 RepID=UPI00062A2599|nr:hemolysin [Rhizobium sp. LC145]KKX27082.1 hemolysin [Rhizobium sp. LC145]TKT56605.1 hemolysin [Rhizobiaceae bacterium LC148]